MIKIGGVSIFDAESSAFVMLGIIFIRRRGLPTSYVLKLSLRGAPLTPWPTTPPRIRHGSSNLLPCMIRIMTVTGVPALLISCHKLPQIGGDLGHAWEKLLDKRHNVMQSSANVEGRELGYAVAEPIVVPHELELCMYITELAQCVYTSATRWPSTTAYLR